MLSSQSLLSSLLDTQGPEVQNIDSQSTAQSAQSISQKARDKVLTLKPSKSHFYSMNLQMLFNTESVHTEILTYINDGSVNTDMNLIELMIIQRVRVRKYVEKRNFSNFLIFTTVTVI